MGETLSFLHHWGVAQFGRVAALEAVGRRFKSCLPNQPSFLYTTRFVRKSMVNLSEFSVITFPDGHVHIKSDKDLHKDTTLTASIKSFDDLFLIAQVKKIHPELTKLVITYLLAARADRRFSPGEAIDVEIVCDYIKSLGFKEVAVVKPHSDMVSRVLPDAVLIDPTQLLYNHYITETGHKSADTYILAPDENASGWVRNYNRDWQPIVVCTKKRDKQTHRVSVEIPAQFDHVVQGRNNCVIVDDLCDGGATFIDISDKIKVINPKAHVFLVVTHVVFSKGVDVFAGKIDKIYCTDSYLTIDHPLVNQVCLNV